MSGRGNSFRHSKMGADALVLFLGHTRQWKLVGETQPAAAPPDWMLDSLIVHRNDQRAETQKLKIMRRQGGWYGDEAGSWLELVVPAVAGAIRAGAVGAVL
jgi:hypothetical protein